MSTWLLVTTAVGLFRKILESKNFLFGSRRCILDCKVGRLHEIGLQSDNIITMARNAKPTDVQELEPKNLVFGSADDGHEYTVKGLYDLWYTIIAEYSKDVWHIAETYSQRWLE
jgi:hypothetical protein